MAIWKKSNKIEVNSDMMKVVIASYFRYTLRYLYTCTEYNYFDICCCNGKYLTEIEVKISYSDLKADAKKTKSYGKLKHDFYSGKNVSKHVLVPNYFYYAITEELYNDDKSIKYIQDNYPSYGIIYIKDWREPIIIKKPTMLNKSKVGSKILEDILKRISSENICLRKKLYDLKLKLKDI